MQVQLGDLDVAELRKEALPQLLSDISPSIGAGQSDGSAGIRVSTIDNYQVERDSAAQWFLICHSLVHVSNTL